MILRLMRFLEPFSAMAGEAALGIGTGVAQGASNVIFGQIAQNQQLRGQRKALQQQNDANYDYWLKTNYGAQKSQMKSAGLNPGLLYGMGGGGGGQSGGASAMPAQQGMGLDVAQLALLKAQTDNIKADTANKMNANPKGIEEVKGLKADNIGKDVEANIRRSLELEEYGARADEFEARKELATNVIKLGQDGKLMGRSLEELEAISLSNAKSRIDRQKIEKEIDLIKANLEGKDIENEIQKLELELQKKTGLDKSSPYYIKMLGRMFMKYFGGKE